MKDEWGVVRDYIADLVVRSTNDNKRLAQNLQQDFAVLEAKREGSRSLYDALAKQGAIIDALAYPIFASEEQANERAWRDLFSYAASLDMKIGNSRRRGRAASIDHQRDRSIAFSARLENLLHKTPLKTAILNAGMNEGVAFGGAYPLAQKEALYKRISRLMADPKENIDGKVFMALREALKDK